MKIVERDFENLVDVSAAVVWWNHWDHEHLTVVHKNYTDAKLLHESENVVVQLVSYRLPLFSWITSNSMGTVICNERKDGGGTFQQFNQGLLGIPSVSTIQVEALGDDRCVVRTNYKFFLSGWRKLLAPILYRMMAKWNNQVWLEDLPLKLRRQKMLRHGFVDFVGMPERVEDRKSVGPLELRVPLARPHDSPVNGYLNAMKPKKSLNPTLASLSFAPDEPADALGNPLQASDIGIENPRPMPGIRV